MCGGGGEVTNPSAIPWIAFPCMHDLLELPGVYPKKFSISKNIGLQIQKRNKSLRKRTSSLTDFFGSDTLGAISLIYTLAIKQFRVPLMTLKWKYT